MTTDEGAGRLFLAVALTEEVRSALRSALPALPGRAVPPESWHLTLRFLGDTSRAAADVLRAELAGAPLGAPFTLRFGGYGAFPRASRASVLWLGVAEGADALHGLADAVEAAVRRAGFAAEARPFRAHLTLSRLRGPQDVRAALDGLPSFTRPLPVTEVVLFRSHLGAGPARYEPLDRFALR